MSLSIFERAGPASLVYRELLRHLLLGQGHDAQFREFESRWPHAAELDLEYDTLHERYDVRPESYPNDVEQR